MIWDALGIDKGISWDTLAADASKKIIAPAVGNSSLDFLANSIARIVATNTDCT